MSYARTIWCGLIAALAIVRVGQAAAQHTDTERVAFNIGAGPVVESLKAIGAQTGLTVMVYSELGRGVMAPAVVGSYTPNEALERILAPAGLQAEYIDPHTVAVVRPKAIKPT